MPDTKPLEYERGTLSAAEVQQAVDEVLEELRAAPDLDALAESAGITALDVRSLTVEVKETGAGVAPLAILVFIAVHAAGGAASAAGGAGATVFFKKVILPRVRKAKRADAIGEEQTDDTAD